jgi:hypothetical protein
MADQRTEGKKVTRAMSAAEETLWSGKPLLASASASGNVISEVWTDGFVCLAMSDARLISPALAALKDSKPLDRAKVALPDQPVMMDRADARFLGRVVIEFRTGSAPMVAAIGPDTTKLLHFTGQRLKQID